MGTAVVIPSPEDISGLDAAGLETALVDIERARRQLEAGLIDVLDEADQQRVWATDGHTSVRAWALALTNTSGAEMMRRLQTMRALRDLDDVRERLRAGEIGVCQTRELAKAHANPRCRDQLGDSAELLTGHAQQLPFDEFVVVMRRWVALADPDGARRDHDTIHAARNAHLSNVGDEYHLNAKGGTAQGVTMEAVFRAFCDAEFATDWAAARDIHGDDVCAAHLARTPAQRRFDALHAIFAAAAASGTVKVPDPLVNIIVDNDTFSEHVAHAAGGPKPSPDPADVDRRRCQTTDGVNLDPRDVVAAAVAGHIRRVVFDTAGVTINLGRKRRLFTGSARDAALLADTHCLWPGCRRHRVDIDHREPWGRHGPTDQHNSAPLCNRHNRWKHHGYTVHRNPDGTHTITRPDGTPLDNPRAA
jgi:hypothetical protein